MFEDGYILNGGDYNELIVSIRYYENHIEDDHDTLYICKCDFITTKKNLFMNDVTSIISNMQPSTPSSHISYSINVSQPLEQVAGAVQLQWQSRQAR